MAIAQKRLHCASLWTVHHFTHRGPTRDNLIESSGNRMTFLETLLSEGYIFNDEDFDSCYVKQDADGNYHLYQEGEDDGDWNYVQMSPLFSVIKEYTVTIRNWWKISLPNQNGIWFMHWFKTIDNFVRMKNRTR